MVDIMVCLKLAGADSHKCNTIPVCLVHICLNLKDKGREWGGDRINIPLIGVAWQRRCRHLQEIIQKSFYTKGRQSRSEKYRREFSFADQLLVKFCTCTVQKLDLFEQLCFLITCHDLIDLRRIQRDLSCLTFFGTLLCIGKDGDLLASTLIDTFEILSGTDRPVDRAGRNAKLLFDVIEQIEGIIGITVHFY